MSNYSEPELRPGLVMHLSPEQLRASGEAKCNADPSRRVVGLHYFLILENLADGDLIITPLYSQPGSGKQLLNRNYKSGGPADWPQSDSYIHRYQQWKVSKAALLSSVDQDFSSPATRRRYAEQQADELKRISALRANNNNDFS